MKICTEIGFSGLKIIDLSSYLKVWTHPVLLGVNSCSQIFNFYLSLSFHVFAHHVMHNFDKNR